MSKLAQKLEKIGFTKTEAKVYLALLRHKSMNGYQIAKILDISRSSVYLALENLCRKNFIFQIPGEITEYKAENPETILTKLNSDFNNNITELKDELKDASSFEPEEKFFNIQGIENVIEKVKDIINHAKNEICINSSLDPFIFEKEFRNAKKRNVRIIFFSVNYLDIKDLPVEPYFFTNEKWSDEERVMIVIDYRKALIAGNTSGRETIGTFTENPLMVKMVSEHINHDIYLSKLHKRNSNDKIIKDEDKINTISENIFFEQLEKIKKKKL